MWKLKPEVSIPAPSSHYYTSYKVSFLLRDMLEEGEKCNRAKQFSLFGYFK